MTQNDSPNLSSSADKTPLHYLVLVIEDNPDAREALQLQLNKFGYNAVCVEHGRKALLWLTENKPDLILLDVMLPDMDGYEVCRRVRHQYDANRLPIIMLSALGRDVNHRVRGLQAGANDFMTKPYHMDELRVRVQNLLRAKNEIDQAQHLLSRYLTTALSKQAALDPDLFRNRKQQHGVVMFADLRGFTRLSANTEIGNVLSLLDEFFDVMMQVIDEHNGIVFDIVGDEIMAVFNIPQQVSDPAFWAVQAALEMQHIFRRLQIEWAKNSLKIGMGIGINQGQMMVGNVGGGGVERYTVIGSVVNLASRLVELAEDGDVVISTEVLKDLQLPNEIKAIPMQVQIKGMDVPQEIFKLVKLGANAPSTPAPDQT